ncbi:MAG: hypothetical protein M3280_02540 [Actinomycetota bacterium]|nr:hypothetical protein [Actinomycetota bacterium]
MRKTLITMLMAAFVLGALVAPAAEAGKRKARKAKGTYDAPSAAVEGNGFCDPGCVSFSTKSAEKTVQMTIVDQTGLPVSAQVTIPDQNGDGFVETIAAFCGKSGKISFPGGTPLSVFIYGHPTAGVFEQFGGPTACQGIGTTGTIKAVFR